jgi:hypothetical protein
VEDLHVSQKINYRRDGKRHQDNGPTWEGGPPNSGSNSTHVAKSRKKWKRRGNRAFRRTEGESFGGYMGGMKPDPISDHVVAEAS